MRLADGPYGVFAGKECARALALMSTQEADCTGNISDLPDDKKGILRDWQQKFLGKYRVVGALQGAAWDTGLAKQARENEAEFEAEQQQQQAKGHSSPLKYAAVALAVSAVGVVAGLWQAKQTANLQ